MFGLFCFVLAVLASPFKSKRRLEAENGVLRHQLIGPFSELESSIHARPLAAFITFVYRKLDSAILVVKAAEN
jgi:hypothetical protein